MGAGEYSSRLRWLLCSRTTDSTTGDEIEVHSPNGYLWCSVDESNGRSGTDEGAVQTGADAQIRIRNFPAVTTLDILLDEAAGYYWKIVSIHNGSNEMRCDAYRNDTLIDFEVDDS